MRDINFFSQYRTSKAKTTDVTLIALLVVVLVGAGIFFGSRLVNARLDAIHAETKQYLDYLSSPDTKDQQAKLVRTKAQALLLEQYLSELDIAAADIETAKIVGVELLQSIESRVPAATQVIAISLTQGSVALDCLSSVYTDPVDMFHALKADPHFIDVQMAGITTDETGHYSFTFTCTLKGVA
jgi:Tfp pilus assembly protein PilN